MFRRLLFCVFFLAGLCGCFGYKVSSLTTPNATDNQTGLNIPASEQVVSLAANKSQTVLKFAKPTKIINVTTSGNDKTGNGSVAKPLRSLDKAFKVAKRNTLIKMGAGTFEVNRMIKVPSRVSLEGVGEKTVIVPGKNYRGVLFEAKDFKNEKGDGYQFFRNFHIDGKDKAKLGFRAWGREHSLFENITFKNLNNAGVYISGLNHEVSNCKFINASGREGKNNKNFSGAIRFMNTDGLVIHGNYIEENSGGGIKSVSRDIWNSEIYNNKINIKGTKNQPVNKSASMEIWDLQSGNRIYNNDLNAWVSFISQWKTDKEIAETGNLIFYKNKLHANPGVTDNMSGVELGMKGAELYDNNFSGFKHRIFWIEGWGGKKKPTKNINIHDNKLNNCGNAMNLGPNGNGIQNLKFDNNFIDRCNGIAMGMGGNKKLINVSITNNTFVKATKAITLNGKSQQYVNLNIAGNQAYNSKIGLDNKVNGLKINIINGVTLKQGSP
ncbi:MAG: right-handed parallel beta-helix repeat-containing protein [Rivularia sp. (in: cyanobacteria)]